MGKEWKQMTIVRGSKWERNSQYVHSVQFVYVTRGSMGEAGNVTQTWVLQLKKTHAFFSNQITQSHSTQLQTKFCFKFGVILILSIIFSPLSVQFRIEKCISKQRVNRLGFFKCQSELSQDFQNFLPPATSQVCFPWLKMCWVSF